MMTGSLILLLKKLIGSINPVLYDLNKFSHSLQGYQFYTGPDEGPDCFYTKNLASHASEATTSAIGPESVRTPQ